MYVCVVECASACACVPACANVCLHMCGCACGSLWISVSVSVPTFVSMFVWVSECVRVFVVSVSMGVRMFCACVCARGRVCVFASLAGAYHIFSPGHSSQEEAWKARPGLHYMCQSSGKGCKRMMQFAGAAHGDYSATGGMGFGQVHVNGHQVTPGCCCLLFHFSFFFFFSDHFCLCFPFSFSFSCSIISPFDSFPLFSVIRSTSFSHVSCCRPR